MKAVINVDTTIPPGKNYQEVIDKIKPYFKKLGYSLEEVIVPEELIKEIPYPLDGPRVNLVATKEYGQDRDISFYAHMDVVPAPNEGKQKWRFRSGRYLHGKKKKRRRQEGSEGYIQATATVDPHGGIYFGSVNEYLYALRENGKLKWQFDAGGWVDNAPIVGRYKNRDVIYVAGGRRLFALNP